MPDPLHQIASDVGPPEAGKILRRNTENDNWDNADVLESDFESGNHLPTNGRVLSVAAGKVVDLPANETRGVLETYGADTTQNATAGNGVLFKVGGTPAEAILEPVEVLQTDLDNGNSNPYAKGYILRPDGVAFSDIDVTARAFHTLTTPLSNHDPDPSATPAGRGYVGDFGVVTDGNGWYAARKAQNASSGVISWTDIGPWGGNFCRVGARVQNAAMPTTVAATWYDVIWNSSSFFGSNGWTYDGTDNAFICPQLGTYRVVVTLTMGVTTANTATALIQGLRAGATAALGGTYTNWPQTTTAGAGIGDVTTADHGDSQITLQSEIPLVVGGTIKVQYQASRNDAEVRGHTSGLGGQIKIERIR